MNAREERPFDIEGSYRLPGKGHQRQGILRFFESTWHRHGDFVRLQVGGQVMFLVVHPDHVRRLIVTGGDRCYAGGVPSPLEHG